MSIRYYPVVDHQGIQITKEITDDEHANSCVKATSANWFLQCLCKLTDDGFLNEDELIMHYHDCM